MENRKWQETYHLLDDYSGSGLAVVENKIRQLLLLESTRLSSMHLFIHRFDKMTYLR